MSYPYPENRRREQREKGQQPYKDAREKMRQNEAELAAQTHPREGPGPEDSEEARIIREEIEAKQRFTEIGDERAREHDDQAAGD